MTTGTLTPVHEALEAGDFAQARELLRTWEGPATAELLDLQGRAAYGAGDLEATLGAYEAAYRLELEAERPVAAAMAAVMVGMYLMMDTGLMAPVRAWLGHAEDLIQTEPDSPVWPWLQAVRTYERFMCGDMPGAATCAQRAIDGGRRHGIVPPTIIGRVALGRVRIHDGQIDEGLRMLDEVAVELTTGNLDPLTTGQMWCELICAMQWVGQHDRAEEWTEAMERWRKGAAFGGLNGRCRVHRAEILRMRGPWQAAEEEALLACEELRPWMRREYGWPLTELGNVRFRKGDFSGAEEAFLAAHQNAWAPQPGLALLRLAQGRIEEASSQINNALEHPFDVPSKEFPPSGGLRRAPLLEAQVTIALAAGTPDVARGAAAELDRIATTYRSRTLKNGALASRGRLALAEGDCRSAIAALTAAVMEWSALRMPFEAATLRVVLASAHRAGGDVQAAKLELDTACRTFEALDAGPWCARVRDAVPLQNTGHGSLPPGTCVFRCEGDMRKLSYGSTTVFVKDLKGMRYLARLLAEPGREFHALDLVTVERGAIPVSKGAVRMVDRAQPGLEVFDATAREAYRRRLAEVDEDIAEAEANNDLERARLARADRQFLVDELARGVGLGGRAREVGAGAERARVSATRALRYALERIAEHHQALAEHLRRSIRSGTYFAYEPDPAAAVRWEI